MVRPSILQRLVRKGAPHSHTRPHPHPHPPAPIPTSVSQPPPPAPRRRQPPVVDARARARPHGPRHAGPPLGPLPGLRRARPRAELRGDPGQGVPNPADGGAARRRAARRARLPHGGEAHVPLERRHHPGHHDGAPAENLLRQAVCFGAPRCRRSRNAYPRTPDSIAPAPARNLPVVPVAAGRERGPEVEVRPSAPPGRRVPPGPPQLRHPLGPPPVPPGPHVLRRIQRRARGVPRWVPG